jgi:GntR family transcriptional regulator, transcriptional repressor for pyruvate dehydrogenase complex
MTSEDEAPPSSVSDSINQRVLKLIVERELVPGDRLPAERVLAHSLGVSRTTLRDALRNLTGRGVLEAKQGSGWYVRLNTLAIVHSLALHFELADMTLGQMIEARRVLEPAIASYAALRRTDADLAELRAILQRMEEVDEIGQHYVDLDQEFHGQIGKCSHNPFFSLAVQPMFELMADLRFEVLRREGNNELSMASHRELVDAIGRQDDREAYVAMAKHLDNFAFRSRDLMEYSSLKETARITDG